MGAPQHVFQVYIRATPERLWQAITDPAMTQIYYFNSRIESDFTVGSPLQYKQPDAVTWEITPMGSETCLL
jgi:uncharacterized protein YndB with AHSA1/START domain